MAAPNFKIIIPARYESERLSGKVLLDIDGSPMLQRVHECCVNSGAQDVYVATCDERVAEAAKGFGAQVVMTADTHRSGTERIIEAADKLKLLDDEIVVNVQGDEPQMPPSAIVQVAELTPADGMATLMDDIAEEEYNNPNVVKVLCDANERAIYFSRSAIPHMRGAPSNAPACHRHLGIYAYRVALLRRWQSWQPCAIEQAEQLEQLRPLYYGVAIALAKACVPVPAGVDTEEDLQRVRSQWQKS